MIIANDFVCCVSELEFFYDIGATKVLLLLLVGMGWSKYTIYYHFLGLSFNSNGPEFSLLHYTVKIMQFRLKFINKSKC